MGEAQAIEQPVHGGLGNRNGKLFVDPLHKVASAPAHNLVHRGDRPAFHQRRQLRLLRGCEFGRRARRGVVDQAVRSVFVEAMHPVAQRLPIHAADLRRIRP